MNMKKVFGKKRTGTTVSLRRPNKEVKKYEDRVLSLSHKRKLLNQKETKQKELDWFLRFEAELRLEDYLNKVEERLEKSVDIEIAGDLTRTRSKYTHPGENLIERVVSRFGGVKNVLKAFELLGVKISKQAIYKWIYDKRVPKNRKTLLITAARGFGILLTDKDLVPKRPLTKDWEMEAKNPNKDIFLIEKKYDEIVAKYGKQIPPHKRKELDKKLEEARVKLEYELKETRLGHKMVAHNRREEEEAKK